jgi:hypothetical protein
MEGVSETGLLSLLGGKCLDRLEIEVVIEMQVVQTFTMNQEVEHIVALTTNLEANLHPIKYYEKKAC